MFALRKNVIKCDVDALEPLDLNPGLEPELTYMHPTAGYHDQATAKAHPFEIVKQSRDAYYAGVHFQTIQFQAAQAVIERLLAGAQKGVDHDYTPDFVVRLNNGLQVVLEIKGYMFDADDRVNEKNQAAKKWVAAVNNLGDFGTWEFLICHKIEQLPARLEELAKREILVSLKA